MKLIDKERLTLRDTFTEMTNALSTFNEKANYVQ